MTSTRHAAGTSSPSTPVTPGEPTSSAPQGPTEPWPEDQVQTLGLIDALSEDGTEVITRRSPGHPSLQLDHIITTPALLNQIRNVAVDPDWTAQSPHAVGLADHAPIRFTLSQPGSAAAEPLS